MTLSSAGRIRPSLLLACFVALAVFGHDHVDAAISTTTLVTEFPHFQTFDSWDECFYIGPCFSQACDSLAGGWLNEEFHGTESPYTQAVRHWWVKKGPTTSNYNYTANVYWACPDVQTGPCNDHTLNNASGGFLYAEASSCQGVFFNVLTPPVEFSNSGAVVSFWYFMHGSNIDSTPRGRLEMLMSVDGGNYVALFNVSGERQNNGDSAWTQFNASLDSYFPSNLNENNTVTAQFRFRAFGAGTDDAQWRGDIAIDDVLFTQAGATGDLVPYIDPIPTNTTEPPGPSVVDNGDGISDGQIAGIVLGVVGGLLLCCLLLIALVVVLLLVISPRKPQHHGSPLPPAGEDL